MSTLVNLTPHALRIYDANAVEYDPRTRSYYLKDDVAANSNIVCELEACKGALPRCTQSEETVGSVNGIAVLQIRYGEVENLPEAQDDVYYVVSAMVANARKDRSDLLIPAHMVRDNEGKILGCCALSRA